ncbi:MAG: hypothetical protein IKU82_00025 [Clostridia bacterium]|nr:hypothetical protein [Clostridia bacterium]
MENETDVIEIKPKNMYASICITQAVCVAVILIAVIIIKFFFEGSYVKLQKWCKNNVLEQTVISDVFDEESDT